MWNIKYIFTLFLNVIVKLQLDMALNLCGPQTYLYVYLPFNSRELRTFPNFKHTVLWNYKYKKIKFYKYPTSSNCRDTWSQLLVLHNNVHYNFQVETVRFMCFACQILTGTSVQRALRVDAKTWKNIVLRGHGVATCMPLVGLEAPT